MLCLKRNKSEVEAVKEVVQMSDSDLDQHVAELETDGYTVVPGVMSESERVAMRQAMHETLEAENEIGRKFRLQTEDLLHSFNAQSKHRHFYGFLLRCPKPIQVARKVLGEDMYSHDVAIRILMPTGTKDTARAGGHLHVDWHQFTVLPFVGGKHYPLAIQSAWCVSEFTKDNGGTLVWPKSHLSLEAPFQDSKTLPPGYVQVEAPAGAVIMWNSALWHTAGVNHSSEPRYSIVTYFQRWWVKGFNDPQHFASPAVRDQMTEEERRIWGLAGAIPPNTHLRDMTPEQIAALTPEEKAVLNLAVHF